MVTVECHQLECSSYTHTQWAASSVVCDAYSVIRVEVYSWCRVAAPSVGGCVGDSL